MRLVPETQSSRSQPPLTGRTRCRTGAARELLFQLDQHHDQPGFPRTKRRSEASLHERWGISRKCPNTVKSARLLALGGAIPLPLPSPLALQATSRQRHHTPALQYRSRQRDGD